MSAVPGAPDPLEDPAVLAAAAALDREVAHLDELGALAAPGAPPELVDWNEEAAQFVTFATEMFFPLYPRLESVWTPAKLAALKARLAPVLKKYDLTLAKLFGKWGPEILLALVFVPQILPTVKAVRADLRDLKAAAIEAARAAPPAGQASAAPAAPLATMMDAASSAPVGPAAPVDALKLHERA